MILYMYKVCGTSVVTSITNYLRAMSIDNKETLILVCHSVSKHYKRIVFCFIKPTTVVTWFSKLNCKFVIQEVLKRCFKATDDTSVQWLQFMILHIFLPVSC